MRLIIPCSSSSSRKTTPFGRRRPLAGDRHAGERAPASRSAAPAGRPRSTKPRASSSRPQLGERVPPDAEPGRAVVGDELVPLGRARAAPACRRARAAAPAGVAAAHRDRPGEQAELARAARGAARAGRRRRPRPAARASRAVSSERRARSRPSRNGAAGLARRDERLGGLLAEPAHVAQADPDRRRPARSSTLQATAERVDVERRAPRRRGAWPSRISDAGG